MRHRGPIDDDISKRYLHMVSSVRIDNLHENKTNQDSPHVHWQRVELKEEEVLERLIRVNQNYKSNIQHALN